MGNLSLRMGTFFEEVGEKGRGKEGSAGGSRQR
jgi:hypothetical protein